MTTIDDKWNAANGRPAGFDVLRITLSIAVILWHSIAVCYGVTAEQWFYGGPLKPVVWFIIPAFFALSGFLVAGSLERNNLVSFVTLRIIRIFPALTAEVVISALLIGPLFTHLALSQYFSKPDFFRYFLNTIGDIHFRLPGVFSDLPVPDMVNSQLWTVPHELECYLAISAAALVGLTRRHRLFLIVTIALIAALTIRDFVGDKPASPAAPPGRLLVLAFLFGVALFLNQRRIAYSFWLFLVSVIGFVISARVSTRAGEDLAALFVAYLTVYLGLLHLRAGAVTHLADCSYGVYLYGFPVQQTVAQLMPQHRLWYINFVISLVVAFILATASWHLLESRVMKHKKRILAFVSSSLDRARHVRLPHPASVIGSPSRDGTTSDEAGPPVRHKAL